MPPRAGNGFTQHAAHGAAPCTSRTCAVGRRSNAHSAAPRLNGLASFRGFLPRALSNACPPTWGGSSSPRGRGRRRTKLNSSSSWPDGEAAVRRRLTLERQVTSTLLPDCTIKPPAAEADQLSLQRPTRGRRVPYVIRDDQGPRLRPAIIELSTARGGLVAPHAYLPLEKSSIFAIDTLTPASPPSSTRCCRDELARFGRHR